MSMQYKFFKIPLNNMEATESEINRFFRSVKVVHVHREFVANNENSFWTMAVEYLPMTLGKSGKENQGGKKTTIDYRELLSPEDFNVYSKIRDWRKEQAAKERLSLYNIFTNKQLAKMAEQRPMDSAALQKIPGIGEAKTKKYGEAVFAIVTAETLKDGTKERGHEASGPTVPTNTDV